MTKRERRYHAGLPSLRTISRMKWQARVWIDEFKYIAAAIEMERQIVRRIPEGKECAIVGDNSHPEAIIWQDKHIYIR